MSNYADDNILCVSGLYMCLWNIAICVYEKDTINDILKFGDDELKTNTLEIVLGIEIDGNLNFEAHIKTIHSKATRKLHCRA